MVVGQAEHRRDPRSDSLDRTTPSRDLGCPHLCLRATDHPLDASFSRIVSEAADLLAPAQFLPDLLGSDAGVRPRDQQVVEGTASAVMQTTLSVNRVGT